MIQNVPEQGGGQNRGGQLIDCPGVDCLMLIALMLFAPVFIAPVLWILEAVPVPLAGPLDVLPANLLLRVVAPARIHHQGPCATRAEVAVAQLEYNQLAIEKKRKK